MLVLFINRYYTVITTIVKEVIMAGLKKLMFWATVAGAAAAGVSYILKYKEYQRELEGEFKDFEDELSDYKTEDATANRKYTALKSTTDEFVTAAKDTANSAKGMASAAKEMLKDVANIITDNVSAAGDVAKDNAKPLFEKAKSSVEPVVDKAKKQLDKFGKDAKKSEVVENDLDSDVEVEFYEMDSDEDKKDLAKKIESGEHIIIPSQDEVKDLNRIQVEDALNSSSLVNINKASKEELMSLPGIGERKAEAIIKYRNSKSFSNIEDIMNISGIKEAAFNKIKDKICIN